MFVFKVNDMCLSSQAAALVRAIKQVDPRASVGVNLEAKEVNIVPSLAGATELSDAIVHAGFSPVLADKEEMHGQPPARIPFAGRDHDFSAALSSGGLSSVIPDSVDRAPASIAGVSKAVSVLPAEALGPLAR